MKIIKKILFYLILTAAALSFIYPFVWMIMASLTPEQDIGKLPKGTKVSADGIFLHGEDLQILDEQGFDLYLPTYGMQAKPENKFKKIDFQYDAENDVYLCPEDKKLTNLLLCPLCNRNLFSIVDAIEEEE